MTAIATKIDFEATEKNIAKNRAVLNELEQSNRDAIRALMNEVEVLEDDQFWALMEHLQQRINRLVPKEAKRMTMYAVQSGTEHFIHALVYQHIRDLGYETDRMLAMRFVATYSELKGKLYTSLDDAVKGVGDDGYGDFVDSFPLHGRELTEAALDGRLLKPQDELDLGENYVNTNLEKALFDLFAASCRHDFEPEGPYEPL
jgi:hypothetical protein